MEDIVETLEDWGRIDMGEFVLPMGITFGPHTAAGTTGRGTISHFIANRGTS
jgi:hypothetical protein